MNGIHAGHLANESALDHLAIDLQSSDDVLGVQVAHLLHG